MRKKSRIISLYILGITISYISFPNIYYHVGWLAWGCLVPILVIMSNYDRYRKRLQVSWIFFQLFFFALFWMNPFKFYERYETIWMIVILIAFYAIFPLVFASVLSIFNHKKKFQSLIILPTIWVIMEYLQTIIPIGFPLSLAISQYQYPIVIQIARFTGIFGVSFVLVLLNVLISFWIILKKQRYVYMGLGLMLVNIMLGSIYTNQKHTKESSKLYTFILIQPNIKWRDAYYAFENNYLYKQILTSLNQLAKQATKTVSDGIIVFPELTISDFNFKNKQLQKTIKTITANQFHVVIGARHDEKNSVFSFSPTGQMLSQYKKNKLVPMFENNETKAVQYNEPLLLYDKTVQLGTFICYESLFPSIARQHTKKGANSLGGVSFNTWLGNTNWAMLHMSYLPFRSVENNRYAFFLNNNGPSIACDEKGQIIENIPLGKKGFMIVKSPVITTKTFYTKFGNIGLIILTILILLRIIISKRIIQLSMSYLNKKNNKKELYQ